MEEKSRLQMLEGILKRFCQVRTLHYDVLKDLLLQLKSVTRTRGDEESSLLFIVRLALKELKKANQEKTESVKTDKMRKVLSDVVNDLTNHIRIYFSENGPLNSLSV